MAKFTITFLVAFARDMGKTTRSSRSRSTINSDRSTGSKTTKGKKGSSSTSITKNRRSKERSRSTSSKRSDSTSQTSVVNGSRSTTQRSKKSVKKSMSTGLSTSTTSLRRRSSRRSHSVVRMPKPWIEIYIHQPLAFMHCDYEIVSGKFKYGIDFVYFGSIIRCYTNDGSLTQCVYKTNKFDFGLFTITHFVTFTNEEIIALHKGVCTFKVYDKKARCSMASYRNLPKTWYLPESPKKDDHFAEVFSCNPMTSAARLVTRKTLNDATNVDLRTKLEHELEPSHKVRALAHIQCMISGKQPYPNFPTCPLIFDQLLTTIQDEKGGKSKKHHKKGKREDGPINSVLIPGEMVFTDPRTIDYGFMNSQATCSLQIFLSVLHLLTPAQQVLFNPIVITIGSVYNLPFDLLTKMGCTEIYMLYSCNLFGEIRTRAKPIPATDNKISFNEGRAFLMHNLDSIEFIKFIQTNRLRIEIRGLRNQKVIIDRKPTLFGFEHTDKHFNEILSRCTRTVYHNTYFAVRERDILLCVATLPNSSLLHHQWTYYTIQSCVGASIPFQNHLNIMYPTRMKLAELNLVDVEDSTLKQSDLFHSDTNVSMSVTFPYPLQPFIVSVLSTERPYNRIFLIFYDETIATNIYNDVVQFNMKILKNAFLLDYADSSFLYIARDKDKLKFEEEYSHCRNAITGFMLDNMRMTCMFLEGPAVGYIQHVWHSVMLLNTNMVKVIYDSDLIFNTRIYSTLLATVGVYTFTLHEPLEMLFKMTFTFMKGNMPLACRRGIRKLDLLLKVEFMTEICQARLCPTLQELMALNEEFGVWLTCARVSPAGVPSSIDFTTMDLGRRGTYLPPEFQIK